MPNYCLGVLIELPELVQVIFKLNYSKKCLKERQYEPLLLITRRLLGSVDHLYEDVNCTSKRG